MSPPVLMRAVLLLSVLLLTACGPTSGGRVSPEAERDYLGAVLTLGEVVMPTPPHGRAPGAASVIRQPLDAALARVNAVTVGQEPIRAQGGALEWRSAPGLADPLAWRVQVVNVGDQWSDRRAGYKPAQTFRVSLQVKPRLAPDAEFVSVMESTRTTPENDWQAELGEAELRVDWQGACVALGAKVCRLSGLYADVSNGNRAAVTLKVTLGETRSLTASVVQRFGAPERTWTYSVSADEYANGAGRARHTAQVEGLGLAPWMTFPSVEAMAWEPDGSGVVERRGMGGNAEISAPFINTECWGADGQIVYYRHDFQGMSESGDPSACAIPVGGEQ